MSVFTSVWRTVFGASSSGDSAVKEGILSELDNETKSQAKRMPLHELMCAYVGATFYAFQNPEICDAAIHAFGRMTDAQKRLFITNAAARILAVLESDASPILRGNLINLILMLPEGLWGRMFSFLRSNEARSETEVQLRARIESDLIDGFTCFPELYSELFLLKHGVEFIPLFSCGHQEVVAIASIILKAAPGKYRDVFVATHGKILFRALSSAPVVTRLSSLFLRLFKDKSASEYGSACMATVQSVKFAFEWIPQLGQKAKENIFSAAFPEFCMLLFMHVLELPPDVAAQKVNEIISRISCNMSPALCDAFVRGPKSPLAFLLDASSKNDSSDAVVSRVNNAILPHASDFLSFASAEAQSSFAIQNPEMFFEAFSRVDVPRLPTCCLAIIQAMPKANSTQFIENYADLFVRFVVLSKIGRIRNASIEMLGDRRESFLMEHGSSLLRRFSACEDQAVRATAITLATSYQHNSYRRRTMG
ncbi:MAG: hypothetical protein LBI34_02035 [Puniceicoccales bacterium]|nr:hypothetical protein [Puniceicoccales bacterium]